MHSADLGRLGLRSGDLVCIESRRGRLHVLAEADAGLAAGHVFLPMHWGSRYLAGMGINELTLPAVDPVSRQPELKHCAVRIGKAELPWRMIAFGKPRDGDSLRQLARVQGWLSKFAYASCGLTLQGVLMRAAAAGVPDPGVIDGLHALFGLDGDGIVRYEDPRRGHSRRIRLEGETIAAACLIGDGSGERWLREFHVEGLSVAHLGARLLAPTAQPPSGLPTRGRIVCACHGVGADAIATALRTAVGDAATRLDAVCRELGCGTGCGACMPELRRLSASAMEACA
jgi:assimilatory nitrate reductase catalytic subunit